MDDLPLETALRLMSASAWKPEIRGAGTGKGREAKGTVTGCCS